MIELTTTWDTVIMLLIAAGVGLIGGIGGGLLEMRRPSTADSNSTSNSNSGYSAKMFVSSVILGGIAAVAILYFFPPQETVTVTVGSETTTTTEYDLTKLVALALIVGSAGAGFLLALQKRTSDLLDAEKAVAANTSASVSASQSIGGLKDQVSTLTKSGVESAATPVVMKAMEDVKAGGAVTSEKVATVVEDLGTQVRETVKESVDPVVQGAQDAVLANATPSVEPAT